MVLELHNAKPQGSSSALGNQGPLAAAAEENLVFTFRKPKRVVLTYLNIVFSFLLKLCLFIESVGGVTANKNKIKTWCLGTKQLKWNTAYSVNRKN